MCQWSFRFGLWSALVGLFVAMGAFAQHRPYRHYDVEQGLAGSTVYCVQQDSAGYLWFGTAAGLSSFDGTTFHTFTTADGLPGNEVLGLVLDQFGRLWVQTFQGPLCYLKDGVFHTPANDPSLTPVVTAAAALGIIPDPEADDVKVIGTEGVFTYSGAALRPIPILQKAMGTHWLRTVGRTLWFMNTEGLHRQGADGPAELVLRTGSKELPAIERVADLGRDVLIHTGSELLRIVCSETEARVSQRRPFAEGLNRAYTDAEGALWITTPSSGAYRFGTNDITTDVAESFAPSSAIPQLIMDRERVLWFASHRDGVFKLLSTQDRSFDVQDGLSSQDLHVVVDVGSGDVLVGTGDGTVERLSATGGVRSATGPNRAGTRVLRGLRTSAGTFFIGDDGAFLVPKTGIVRHWPTFGACKALAGEPDGNVLVGTAVGLFRVSPGTGAVLDTLSLQRCTAVLNDGAGRVLVGGMDGLRVMGTDSAGLGGLVTELRGMRITDLLLMASGTIAVSTHGKGVLIADADGTMEWLTVARTGLSGDICGRSKQDERGRLWVCTDRGLDRLVREGGRWKVRNYAVADGLPDNEVRDVLVRGDSLWVATHKGLAMLVGAGEEERSDLHLRITGVRFNGRDTLITDRYRVPHDRNDISISFVALHMRSDGRITYRYRLSDKGAWQYTTANTITLPRATPGAYALAIQARTSGGTWGGSIVRIGIVVEAPWWQRPWVLAGILSALLLGAGLVFHRRQRRLISASRERERHTRAMAELELQAHRARIDPHFVFNCLNSIQGFVINEDTDKAHRYIAQFASYVRRTLRVARLNFIPLREEIELLREQTALEMMRTRQAFSTRIEVDAEVPLDTEVPTMLLQTFVENAIKHGLNPLRDRAGELLIHFSRSDDGLVCTIADNGVGLNAVAQQGADGSAHTSEGLNLVKERIALFNTQFGMDIRMAVEPGSEGGGTTVRVTIPIERTSE